MSAVLLDTHAWAWSLTGDRRLSARAISSLQGAEQVFVSPVSLFEIGQKVRIGKWPEMAPFVERLAVLAQEQGASIAALTPEVCLNASMLAWDHRDPFDRLLAATAIDKQIALVSADAVFDDLNGKADWVTRLW